MEEGKENGKKNVRHEVSWMLLIGVSVSVWSPHASSRGLHRDAVMNEGELGRIEGSTGGGKM